MKEQILKLLSKIKDKIVEKSPEILIGVGIVGSVGATVLACKATLKSQETIKKNKEYREIIDNNRKKLPISKYSIEDYKKDRLIVSANTVKEVGFNFLPAITVGMASIASILCGYKILSARTVALLTAYNAIEKSFMTYRQRVIQDQGKEKDQEYITGLKAIQITKKDKDGKKIKETKYKTIYSGGNISQYARWFTEPISKDKFLELLRTKPNLFPKGTTELDYIKFAGTSKFSSYEYNMMTLKALEECANDLLQTEGVLFLNDVYKMLGFSYEKQRRLKNKTTAGQFVGWDLDNPDSDHYVSFGLDKVKNYPSYLPGAVLLDFNVCQIINPNDLEDNNLELT